MAEERTYKITCDVCGYSKEVTEARLVYEEGKTCPICYKGRMYWVPSAEEARRREFWKMYGQGGRTMPEERRISPAWIIPIGIILGIGAGLGLIVALARAAVPPGCLKLGPDRFYYFTYTGPSQNFLAALGECAPVIYTIDIYDEETDDWIPPVRPDIEILHSGTKCRVKVQETCTLCDFEPIT